MAGESLTGKVALVTGAGSAEGIGFASARLLGQRGARVAVTSTTDRIHERAAELVAEGIEASGFICDLAGFADAGTLLAEVEVRFGPVDILVNNAGIARSGPAEDETIDSVRDLLDTNTVGLFALTQLVGRHMLDRGRGSIVNIASPSATTSLDRYGLAGYAASKGAVVALTRELAAQWAGRGVRVNALSPSFFPSNTTGWLADGDQVAWISNRAPIGRPPRADELDGPLLFLASDASSYVTGQNLVVDGGWTTR
jgi:NAD(P)-dependent dehydrogenase (short-subunit alcohol dehydrogenase family)